MSGLVLASIALTSCSIDKNVEHEIDAGEQTYPGYKMLTEVLSDVRVNLY